MRLTPDQHETLRVLGNGLGRADEDAYALERLGLCITGHGRFGSWARITDAGRQYLDRMSGQRSRRASPRQVLAAPAPKAAASKLPGRGSRAGRGSCSPAGSPCVDRHNVSTPLPRPASTPERQPVRYSRDRATSSTRSASFGDAKAATGSRQGHVSAPRVPTTTARAPTERALASAASPSPSRPRAAVNKVTQQTMSSARARPTKKSR